MIKHRIQITDFRVQQAIDMYKEGKGFKDILKDLRMDGATLNRFLNELGLKTSHGVRVRARKSKAVINDNALDILTPEALYWIGFIYADGHLAKDRPRIVIGLSEVDKGHLLKAGKFFGNNVPVTLAQEAGKNCLGYKSSASWRISFSSKKLYDRLGELGVYPRKTYSITPHQLLVNSRDFWRGVVDGDGWITNKKVKGLGLCGAESTITAFLKFLNISGLKVGTNPAKSKRSNHLWSCDIHHNKATTALYLLYKDACVYLDRKYEKYLEIVNNN